MCDDPNCEGETKIEKVKSHFFPANMHIDKGVYHRNANYNSTQIISIGCLDFRNEGNFSS